MARKVREIDVEQKFAMSTGARRNVQFCASSSSSSSSSVMGVRGKPQMYRSLAGLLYRPL
jgi:hypothetical protein